MMTLLMHLSSSRIILLNKLLEDGNTLYRKNRYDEAAHRYQYALRRLPGSSTFSSAESSSSGSSSHSTSNDQLRTFDQLKVHLLLNLSRCKRKMGDFNEAANKASEVLRFRPQCLEALQARARAFKESERFEEAIVDLTDALKLSPQNRDIHKSIIKVKEELRAWQNNNNEDSEKDKIIGMEKQDKFKFVDASDTASNVTEVDQTAV